MAVQRSPLAVTTTPVTDDECHAGACADPIRPGPGSAVRIEHVSISTGELRVRQLLGVWRCRTPTTGAGVVAAGEDPEKVGAAADLVGVAFVPVTIELSKVAVEGGADLLMPFTSSQPANTIS